MNVAKWLLLGILTLPFAELAVFAMVAVTIGLGWTLALLVGTTLAGIMILRHAGGNHIARVRVAMADGNISALRADRTGAHNLLGGILLVLPGFITDALGLLVLLGSLVATLRRGPAQSSPDGVIDLAPDQWRRVPDPRLPHRGEGHAD